MMIRVVDTWPILGVNKQSTIGCPGPKSPNRGMNAPCIIFLEREREREREREKERNGKWERKKILGKWKKNMDSILCQKREGKPKSNGKNECEKNHGIF